ncbi:MAG: hypothetical protein AAGA92_13710 [Planctomycetota bacterium]
MDQIALSKLSWALALFALIFVMTAAAVTFVRRLRDRDAKDTVSSNELISNFRDLHARGGLSDEEFRTIKAKLANELRAELNQAELSQPELSENPTTG